MSRIGRLPVTIPDGVEVTVDGQLVTVLGPRGTLEHRVAEPIKVARGDNGELQVTRPDDERVSKSLHGLTRTLVANMVTGVTTGYEKRLEIVGVGYRVVSKGPTELEFALGFSHPVKVTAPEGITLQCRDADQVLGARHRQAAGRRGGGEYSQDPQAGAVQGQRCPIRGREGSPQGWKGW